MKRGQVRGSNAPSFADGRGRWVVPHRRGSVELGELAADCLLAHAAVRAAGEHGDAAMLRVAEVFVLGGDEASELGRDREEAAPGSVESAAVGRRRRGDLPRSDRARPTQTFGARPVAHRRCSRHQVGSADSGGPRHAPTAVASTDSRAAW